MDLDEPLTCKPVEPVETLRDRLESIEDKAEIALALALIALLIVLVAAGERK